MSTLLDAIIAQENTNPAYNNPGAITDNYPGATGETFGAGIPIYSTYEQGLAALQTKIGNIYSGNSSVYNTNMTLDQFGSVYAPGQNYGTALAKQLGVPSSTQLSQINSGTQSNGVLDTLKKAFNPLDEVTSRANVINPTGEKTWLGLKAENIVIVLVGLLLIAAGLFAFKTTQNVITTVAKHGKTVAELAT